MNKFNAFTEKINFKKFFTVYFIAAVLIAAVCAGTVGYIFSDKISLALQYEKASEAFKRHDDITSLKKSADTLADSSADICDIFILDNNTVVYSAKNSKIFAEGNPEFEKRDGSKFMQSRTAPSAVFRFVKKDEFMLASVFADGFKEIWDEYDEDSFYIGNFQNKKLYTISLLGKSSENFKAYVISDPSPVKYGLLSLKIAAGVLMLLFMIYWIAVAVCIYQNARKSKLSAPVWGIITLFTNLVGVLIYLIYKHINSECSFCGAVQAKGNVFCTFCGNKIGSTCRECGHFLKPSDSFCPQCGHGRG